MRTAGFSQIGNAPSAPKQVIGREVDLHNIKALLIGNQEKLKTGVVRLGQELKLARGRIATEDGKPLTQELLAERVERSVDLIRKAERGEPILITSAERIANGVGCSLNELVAQKGDAVTLNALIAVRGLPGVGKTTIAAKLAHDSDIKREFEGMLWVSLGQRPDVLSELKAWGRALGIALEEEKQIKHARARLAAVLRGKRLLIIIDDAWTAESAFDLMIGGTSCATIVTTRVPAVANAIAPTEQDLYVLNVLNEDDAVKLLMELAASIVSRFPEDTRELAKELERLPLALQVAGRLLRAEESKGLEIRQLLVELRDSAKLLDKDAPGGAKVAALLKKSTDVLDAATHTCFAYLAPFAEKPATFDLEALRSMWEGIVDDPSRSADLLISRGLLEPVGGGRFWLHALLVAHAKAILDGKTIDSPD